MKILGVIPARFASTRFPGKPLADLLGKSMVERVYLQCKKAKRLAAIETERQSALRPDKEKLEAFAKKIGSAIDFEVKDEKAQAIVNDITTMIGKMQIHILKKIKEL